MVLKLNARDFGIPQNRSRVFTIGVNKRHYGKENSTDVLERIKQRINDAKSPEKALMEAISDLPTLKASRVKNNTSHESVENGYTIQKKTSNPVITSRILMKHITSAGIQSQSKVQQRQGHRNFLKAKTWRR